VTTEQLQRTSASQATVALGPTGSEAAAKELDNRFHVPYENLELPIGLRATDRFVNTLRKLAHVPIPDSIQAERGRMMDIITDMHQYFYGRRVAVWATRTSLCRWSSSWPISI